MILFWFEEHSLKLMNGFDFDRHIDVLFIVVVVLLDLVSLDKIVILHLRLDTCSCQL